MWDWLDRHADVRTLRREIKEDIGDMHHVDFDWYLSHSQEEEDTYERD